MVGGVQMWAELMVGGVQKWAELMVVRTWVNLMVVGVVKIWAELTVVAGVKSLAERTAVNGVMVKSLQAVEGGWIQDGGEH